MRCNLCRFWKPVSSSELNKTIHPGDQDGLCYRFPPVLAPRSAEGRTQPWVRPVTCCTDFCGEYQPPQDDAAI